MDLMNRINHIIYSEKLKVKDFLAKVDISRANFYNIKNGDKTELKPSEGKKIVDAFPEYDYDWLMGNNPKDKVLSVDSGSIMELAEKGKLGKIMLDNHSKLLELDPTYQMWFDKEINVRALDVLLKKRQGE